MNPQADYSNGNDMLLHDWTSQHCERPFASETGPDSEVGPAHVAVLRQGIEPP